MWRALARRTVESLDAVAGRTVIVDASPVVLTVDPPKLERIVENLVDERRPTHPPRTDDLAHGVAARDDGVLLSVEDDGPGVPAELREAIFEPFRQGPTAVGALSRHRHRPLAGRRFAELHGGARGSRTVPGGGASFRCSCPSAARGPKAPDRAETASARQAYGCSRSVRIRSQPSSERSPSPAKRLRIVCQQPAPPRGLALRRRVQVCFASPGSISRVRSASTTSCRSRALDTMACTMAATGRAMNAPDQRRRCWLRRSRTRTRRRRAAPSSWP